MRRRLLLALVVGGAGFVWAQPSPPLPVRRGGLAAELRGRNLWLTPDTGRNRRITRLPLDQVPEFGFSRVEGGAEQSTNADAGGRFGNTVIAPELPAGWRWLAAFNAPGPDGPMNFFCYDGWLAVRRGVRTNHRLRTFGRDITAEISSNAYHMAFRGRKVVEDETFMLVVSPVAQQVTLVLPPEHAGGSKARTLSFYLQAGEARFVHFVIPPPEYTNLLWRPERGLRPQQQLNAGWRFTRSDPRGAQLPTFDDRSWARVNLPHTWNADDLHDPRPVRDSLEVMPMYDRGPGWYRLRFNVSAEWRGRYVRLDVGAAANVAEVWLNGQRLGQHRGGYTDFHLRADTHLKFGPGLAGENVLAIRVDNSYRDDLPPRTADYNFQGGLYRQVWLTARPLTFIKHVAWNTPELSAARAQTELITLVRNFDSRPAARTLVTNLVDPLGEIVQSLHHSFTIQPAAIDTIRQRTTVLHPWLWHPDHPHRYRIVSTLYEGRWPAGDTLPTSLPGPARDQVITTLGFRWYSMSADSGLSLNGRRLKLKGVNVHQDYLHRGWAVDSGQKARDFTLIKQMGANAVRLAHYPHHPYSIELCDSLGLIVWSEIPVVNTVSTSEAFARSALEMIDEMITRDRHHPSIFFWGVGNEYYRAFFPEADVRAAYALTQRTTARVRQLDPYRPSIQAQNDLVRPDIMALTDVQGRNSYFGWYEGTYDDFAREMSHDHRRHPEWKLVVSEYGAEGKQGYHVNEPKLFDHSESYQLAFHKAYWSTIRDSAYIAGGFLWNMFDFYSFTKIGNAPRINAKGTMTLDRRPKDLYYYYQSQWADALMAYVVSHHQPHRHGRAGEPHPIEVFSNADQVTLIVDGRAVSTRTRPEGYTWAVPLSPGAHTVEAVATRHGQTVTDRVYFHYHHR